MFQFAFPSTDVVFLSQVRPCHYRHDWPPQSGQEERAQRKTRDHHQQFRSYR